MLIEILLHSLTPEFELICFALHKLYVITVPGVLKNG